uniref:Slc4a-8 n=1 Tax=Schmidtea mediterranea TaxID=79327 RepID=A0A0H3YK00_SCHMD|nr:slc4a-8 [Schmidtea mediterranea]
MSDSDLGIQTSLEEIPLKCNLKRISNEINNHNHEIDTVGHNIYSSRRPSSLHQTTFSGRNYYSMPTGEQEVTIKDNRTSISSHLFLLPPSPGRRLSRQRQGSSASNVSVDNMSNISGSTLAYCLQNADETEDDSVPCLFLSRLEKIPMKDFSAEVRATLDIQKFLKEAVLLLDMSGSCLEEIIDSMLLTILANEVTDAKVSLEALVEEAKKTLFIQSSYLTYTYQRLAKTIRGLSLSETEGLMTDQSWLCTMCSLNCIHKRHVAIARLNNPVNMGRSSEGIYFIILVVTPTKEKGTKSDIELGRTFATIFADVEFRQQLLFSESVEQFKELLQYHSGDLMEDQAMNRRKSLKVQEVMNQAFHFDKKYLVGSGIVSDFKKRFPVYLMDFRDGFRGKGTIRKVISATIFLYFACLLPSIAFGVLNYNNTEGKIDVRRVIISQAIGGLCFGFFSGQPLIILLTTAPLALFVKIISSICNDYDLDFFAMYSCVGLINSLLLILYAMFDISKLMRWSTRSSEEIFALFVAISFVVDAVKDIYKEFSTHYFSCYLSANNQSTEHLRLSRFKRAFSGIISNISISLTQTNLNSSLYSSNSCQREVSILYLFLVAGTVWLAIQLFTSTKTPFLNNAKREMLTDFALPLAVVIMSLIGTYLFKEIEMQPFVIVEEKVKFEASGILKLPWLAIAGAIALAFPLSLLMFMDQNISSAMVNSPANKLKKGSSYHWDLLVVALINAGLSVFGLPLVHGALPHSPLHVKALADLEERIDTAHHVHQTIVKVRETRITSILSHVFIGISLQMLPIPLIYIPVAVLDGLFVYMAVTTLYGNQFFERILLLFTEQSAYPPSHYLRRVPQRKLHIFTGLQIFQLAGLCLLGFSPSPYLKMGFPLLLLFHMVFRHQVVPRVIDEKYLNALDKPI